VALSCIDRPAALSNGTLSSKQPGEVPLKLSSHPTIATALCLLLGSALLLAACGGDDEPSTGPDEVTKQFLVALSEQDGDAACALISEGGIEDVEEQAGESCEDAVSGEIGEVSDEDRRQVEDATYEIDEESDDSASVTATRPDGDSETFELVTEDGEWRVDG
jgi:hypothetical protein